MSMQKFSIWLGFMISLALCLQGCSSTPVNTTSQPIVKDTKAVTPTPPVKVKLPPQEQSQPFPQPTMNTD